MENAILTVLVGLGAGFVQRVSGFGLGIFAMLFLPYFMPTLTAAATVSCLFSVGTSTYNTIKYKKAIPFKKVLPLLFAAMLSIPVAVYFSAAVSAPVFEKILGTVLILISIYFLFFMDKIIIHPTTGGGIFAGMLGGTLNGLFSTGGPPVVLYLTNAADSTGEYFAAIQFYFCITNIYATIMRAAGGLVTYELLLLSLWGFLGCLAGDFAGKLLFDKLNAKKLKYIIYIGMIISGIFMIV